jgi:hypothetical protein
MGGRPEPELRRFRQVGRWFDVPTEHTDPVAAVAHAEAAFE